MRRERVETKKLIGNLANDQGCGAPRLSFAFALARTRSALVALVVIVMLSGARPALAKSPTGDFVAFSHCPRFSAGVGLCIFAQIESGMVAIGGLRLLVEDAFHLQGGIIKEQQSPFRETFVDAVGAPTIAGASLSVPGGLVGLLGSGQSLPKQLKSAFTTSDHTEVTATISLAGTVTMNKVNLLDREGPALSLPVRVKLENAFLGNDCYVGSIGNPVLLNLTTGWTSPPPPAVPIEGVIGVITQKDEFEYILIQPNSFVDNAFSAPRVSGCGGALSSVLDPIIDGRVGFPSPPGRNAAILNGPLTEAGAVSVIASER